MGVRRIENKRPDDLNIQKNRPINPAHLKQAFTMDPAVVQCRDDRDALIEALQFYIWAIDTGVKAAGRDHERDLKLLVIARRVLARIL